MMQIYSRFYRHYIGITLGVITVFYLLTLRGIAGNLHPLGIGNEAILSHFPPFETSMERGRYAQIISLAEHGSFTVDAFAEFLKPDLAWYNGHFYSAFPPGVAVLSFPFYLFGRLVHLSQVFAFLPTLLISLATGYLIGKIGERYGFSKVAVIMSMVIFNLASDVWSYSVSISAHPFSAFFISLAFFLALSLPKENNRKKFFLTAGIWMIFAANLFIDYPNLVILLPILAYACWCHLTVTTTEQKIYVTGSLRMLPTIVGVIPFLVLFVWFNLSHFQKPIAFTNTYNLKRLEIQGIAYTYDTLSNDLFKQKSYTGRFQLDTLLSGAQVLLISPDRGVFQYFPIYLLALVGFVMAAIHRSKGWGVALATIIVDVLFYGSFDDPWGGWGFGPRYMIVVLPLLALMAGYGYDIVACRRGWFLRFLIYGVLLFSIGVSLLGALTTNGVPPAVEVRGLEVPSNYVANWQFLNSRGTSSFFFSQTFWYFMAPEWYYVLLLAILAAITLPLFLEKEDARKTKS